MSDMMPYYQNHSTFLGKPSAQKGVTSWVLLLFAVAILVTALVAVLLGHKIGYQRGFHKSQAEIAETADGAALTIEQIQELKLKTEILSNDVASAKQELAISLTNLDEVRSTVEDLKVENRQLQQVNDVFADYIADKGGMPLKIIGAKIEPLPENAFEYGFDIAMVSSDGSAKTMTPTLTLLNDDSLVDVPLDPKRYDLKGVSRIRGRFVMPEDFNPLQVKLSIRANGQTIEQLYNWRLGQNVEDMPLSLGELPEVDANPIEPDQE